MTMTRLQLVDLHSGMECESLEGLGVKGCHLHLYRKPDPKRGCRPSALTEVSTGNPQHLAGMESTAGHLMKAGLALGKEASQVHSKNIQLEYNAFNQELQYLKHTEKERERKRGGREMYHIMWFSVITQNWKWIYVRISLSFSFMDLEIFFMQLPTLDLVIGVECHLWLSGRTQGPHLWLW